MKPFEYYSKPQTLYPNKQDYITFYVYDRGELLFAGFASTNSKIKLKEDYPNAVIQEVLDEERYKAHRKEYESESAKLRQEFQNDLFEDFGVSDNPKRFKCFDLAWELGHSSGLQVVYTYFGDFVDLIKD